MEGGNFRSQRAFAKAIGLSHARVSQVLGLLRLCSEAREALDSLGDPLYSRKVTERKLRPIVNLLPELETARAVFFRSTALSVLSVIRSVGVPLGITTPGQPNISSTIWRTVADHKNKVYFFDSATSPNVFWVPFSELDLTEGAGVKKLTLAGGKIYSGNAAGKFEPAQPFSFMPANPEPPEE